MVKRTANASYRAIRDEIARRIAQRVWEPGAFLPGEEALAQEFGAARATVNRALQELSRGGLIERKRKVGTRVSLNPVREARFAIPLVRNEIEAKGAAYRYVLLSREMCRPPEIVRARLELPEEARMMHVRCLHLADRAPYQFEDRWINSDAAEGVATEPFDTIGPNEWLVRHAPFSRAEFIFFADEASPQETELLQLRPGSPIFVGERVTWFGQTPITLVRMAHPPAHRMISRL